MKYALAILALLSTSLQVQANDDFPNCLAALQERARGAGVDEQIVEQVIPSMQQQKRALKQDRQQPEFVQTFQDYLNARVTPQRIARGRQLLKQHRSFLLNLQARYGVPPHYLLAFWGLETNFGGYMGKMPTLDSLATMACDQRRSEFFSKEFIAALQLMQRESLSPDDMKGSWAGAVGHTQFMPSSYLSYAVDGDGDGRINLWDSERDALASGANYLQTLGWQSGLRWGREVSAGANFPYELAGRNSPRPLAEWAAKGLKRNDGAALPMADVDAALLLPAGYQGPAFLVYDNFKVIMRWNRSELYAIAVGHLADRIAGAGALLGNSNSENRLRTEDILFTQRSLNHLGYEAGAVDGVLGSGTRAALRDFQLANQLIADGYPNPSTLSALAKRAPSP